jgi:quercetin dioxygenase-like cupin family protein
MMSSAARLHPWSEAQIPSENELRRRMADQGLSPYRWSNVPGERYPAHSHAYDKVIYIIQGSITFEIPQEGERFELFPGDCLDLPAGIVHHAEVGQEGVACLEAHRESELI